MPILVNSAHPIFEKYTIAYLAKVTGYQPNYIRDVRSGHKPLAAKFRRLCAAVLRESEQELFGAQEA